MVALGLASGLRRRACDVAECDIVFLWVVTGGLVILVDLGERFDGGEGAQ